MSLLDNELTAQTRAGLEQTSAGLEQTSAGLEQTSAGLEQTCAGLEQTWRGLEQTWQGLEQTSRGLEQTRQGLEQTCRGLEQTSAGLEQTSVGFEQTWAGLEPLARTHRRRHELARRRKPRGADAPQPLRAPPVTINPDRHHRCQDVEMLPGKPSVNRSVWSCPPDATRSPVYGAQVHEYPAVQACFQPIVQEESIGELKARL